MSYSGERFDIVKQPGQSLAVSQCGMTIYGKGHKTPTMVYSHYSAHFILSGKGRYMVNGKTYYLSAGEGFLIIPDIPNSYEADENDPWTYIYANFYGVDDSALVHYAGLSEDKVTFSYDMTDDMLRDIHAMHKAASDESSKGYEVTGYFLLVMSRLVKNNSVSSGASYLDHHYVTKAISFIEDNYSENIKVTDVSDFVGIDRSYLYKLFVHSVGMSPSRYIIDYRLKKAELMMRNTGLSLSEIACACGFFDLSHFSGAFSAKFGMPPNRFRNKCDS